MEIRFTFGFFAAWAIILSTAGTAETTATVLALSLAHEGGHIAAMLLTGTRLRRLTFHFGGISIKKDKSSSELSLIKEIIILSAGSFVNFIIAFLCLIKSKSLPLYITTGLGLFNLLPFSRLDGGRIIKAVAESIDPTANTDAAQGIVDVIILIISIALFLFGITGPSLLAAFLALMFQNHSVYEKSESKKTN